MRCVTVAGLAIFLCLGFKYFTQNSYLFRFATSYSPLSQLRLKNQVLNAYIGDNENTGNNQRLRTKMEYFCLEVQFGFWLFLLAGFWDFANFGPGCWVLVPPKASSRDNISKGGFFSSSCGITLWNNIIQVFQDYSVT